MQIVIDIPEDVYKSIIKAYKKDKKLQTRPNLYKDEFPPVTPKQKTGHWIDIMVGDMPVQACDRCNTFYPLAYTGGGHKYCPNCGAKMENGKRGDEE